MNLVCDFHIHSKFSRATSQKMNLENIAEICEKKGIDVVATGDFTHPIWFEEIKQKLEEDNGLLYLKNKRDVAFILSVEVNNSFNFEGKERKVHNVILSPSIEVSEQINELLSKFSKLDVDGRPTIAMSNAEMLERLKEISKDIEVFAAHAWTPWFGVFGSKSGFDSLKDAYEGKEKELLGIETGLSSDLEMNFCVSALDNFTLISNSDAHSLEKIGREANVIEAKEKSYKEIIKAIKEKKVSTIEYFPQEGKYHYDGHRNCGVSFSPEETKKFNGICPVCRKPLTIGVLHRVFELGDRQLGYIPKNAQKSIHLIPLIEIISKVTKKDIYSIEVEEEYNRLTKRFKEIELLSKTPIEEIREINENVAIAVKNVREGKVKITPGYDGVYGKIEIEGFENSFKLKPRSNKQQPLF